jgi:protein TonB
MESKKNPKADVGKNGSIYFAVGLALMLFLTYSTINWKTYDKSDIDIGKLNLDDELDEEIPIIEQIIPPPPPPPPPAAPEVIEVVEDEEEVEETVIESTETDQDEKLRLRKLR